MTRRSLGSGINPDPARFDGVLLPFQLRQARPIVQRVLKQQARTRDVTLARATLHDGQTLLAFNDLFVGVNSHVSARYQLRAGDRQEEQSSSGILVCTGAGSTGWMSSVFNMARGIAAFLNVTLPEHRLRMTWEDRRLLWAVREPFVSQTTQASLVMGSIVEGDELVVESLMPAGGVIFSDGVESDFLECTKKGSSSLVRSFHDEELGCPKTGGLVFITVNQSPPVRCLEMRHVKVETR